MLLVMYQSHILIKKSDKDDINSIAGKILHIFLVCPICVAVVWYYIIGFPGYVNPFIDNVTGHTEHYVCHAHYIQNTVW
jgi:hypothetical protein